MSAKITFFPVDNGDMTLIKMDSDRTLLIDCNIREASENPNDDTPDVAHELRKRLRKDNKGRYYVDAFLLSHPDQDHCRGLEKHFHLGHPEDCPENKILIREIWSSPLVFRRAPSSHTLCSDAKAFNREAKRRVNYFRDNNGTVGDGERIKILGRDENGKTDGLEAILIEVNELITTLNGAREAGMQARLLAPLPQSEDSDEEALLSKNNSSVILRFTIEASGDVCRFLTGGDAGVDIWERLWTRHSQQSDWLEYDLLLAPHHCSWRSLSHDSWSECGEEAEVSHDARSALAQACSGAHIVSSSKPIKNDDSDPPCDRAKREYLSIIKPVSGKFLCTGEYPSQGKQKPIEFTVDRHGLSLDSVLVAGPAIMTSSVAQGAPLAHG